MISVELYFRQHAAEAADGELTDEIKSNATDLVSKVNALLSAFYADKRMARVQRSGWRPVSYNANFMHLDEGGAVVRGGAPRSTHCTGQGVDIADNDGELDAWLTDEILERFDLYRESPASTPSWCHLQTRKPGTGHRTFNP